jgi:hypothetical protein
MSDDKKSIWSRFAVLAGMLLVIVIGVGHYNRIGTKKVGPDGQELTYWRGKSIGQPGRWLKDRGDVVWTVNGLVVVDYVYVGGGKIIVELDDGTLTTLILGKTAAAPVAAGQGQ